MYNENSTRLRDASSGGEQKESVGGDGGEMLK